jgi:hypothetical protein
VGWITARRSAGVGRLVLEGMEHHPTTGTGHRGLWIALAVVALVVVIALVYMAGGSGGASGGAGY